MRGMSATLRTFISLFLLVPSLALAQQSSGEATPEPQESVVEEPATVDRWTGSAELSFVATAGNSESRSLGFGAQIAADFDAWDQQYRARLLEVETEGEKTAEALEAGARIDRAIREEMSAFGELSYLRNRFAGIANRYRERQGSPGRSWKGCGEGASSPSSTILNPSRHTTASPLLMR